MKNLKLYINAVSAKHATGRDLMKATEPYEIGHLLVKMEKQDNHAKDLAARLTDDERAVYKHFEDINYKFGELLSAVNFLKAKLKGRGYLGPDDYEAAWVRVDDALGRHPEPFDVEEDGNGGW